MRIREEILQQLKALNVEPVREDENYIYFQSDLMMSNVALLTQLGYHADIHSVSGLARVLKMYKKGVKRSAPPCTLYDILLQAFNITNITETHTQINFDTTSIDVVLALGAVDVVSTYQETNKGYHVTIYLE